jgi:hypothetical protein
MSISTDSDVAFYLRPSSDGIKHNASLLFSHHGSDAVPEYSLRHPDPSLTTSKNRYAAALYDIYNPEILFGEVLLIPDWSHPTPTKEEIRLNGGVPPAPQPFLPTEFVIQLYNPDQQVKVRVKPCTWNTATTWEFEMPQQSFRQPSVSSIDRTQSDPTASETTPKVNFRWKKDGKLSKDYVCSIAGRSTNPDGSKRKNKEPDIPISLFRHLREITLYESNLSRIEMEDPKGLEVVLLLGAIVIREVYNGRIQEAFNITEAQAHVPNIKVPPPPQRSTPTLPSRPGQQQPQTSSPRLPLQNQSPNTRPPPTDPRTQWELDAETARLKKQVEKEERERKRLDHAQTKRVKMMIEAEEREAARLKAESDRQKQAEIDKETDRLRRVFEAEKIRAQQGGLYVAQPVQRPHSAQPRMSGARPQQRTSSGPYMQPLGEDGAASSFSLAPVSGRNDGKKLKAKKSFWGLGGGSREPEGRLVKKQSSIF